MGVDFGDESGFAFGGQEGGGEGVTGQLAELVCVQAQVGVDGLVVVVDVAAEVGGVVGVDGDEQAGVEQGGEGVLVQGGDGFEAHVGQGAHGEGGLGGGQVLDQVGVVQAADAVVDALGAQQVQGLPDVGGGAFFAGVGDAVESHVAGGGEHFGEFFGWVADFGGVQAHGVDVFQVGACLVEGVEGFLGGAVTQEAQDEAGADVVGAFAVVQGGGEAVDDGVDADAAAGVGLGVEEDLGVAYALGGGAGEVGVGQVGEVGFGA